MEFSAALAAFLLPGQVQGMLQRTMNDAIQNYNKTDIGQEAVDVMQSRVRGFYLFSYIFVLLLFVFFNQFFLRLCG